MLSATQTPQLQHQYSEATSSSNLSSGKGSDEERHGNGTSVQETEHRLSFFNWTLSAKKNKKEDMVRWKDDEEFIITDGTVHGRLNRSLKIARYQREKCKQRGKAYGYSLNIALGLQLLLGALVTGLSSVVSPTRVGLVTSILGGFSTIVASFLARMRGNSEPELSNNRAQALEQFIRRCEEYVADHGRETGEGTNKEVQQYRDWLDEILKNPNDSKRSNADRKKSEGPEK